MAIMNGAEIEKAVICRTPAYHQMWRRPWHANLNQNLNAVREVTAGTDFSASRLTPVAAVSILPSSQPECQVEIPNGWNTERCMFSLKIVHAQNHDGTIRFVQYLTGYTDYCGMQRASNGIIGVGNVMIDPNMRMFFNSSLLFQETRYANGYGQMTVQIRPLEASQLLVGRPGGVYDQMTFTCRPEDVYSAISGQELMAAARNSGSSVASQRSLYDGRVTFQPGQPYKKSTKSNLIPSQYLSRLFTDVNSVTQQAVLEANVSNEAVASKLSSTLNEGYICNDMTLQMLMERTGLAENGTVTYAELSQLFPNLDRVMFRAGMENGQVQGTLGAAGSEYFHGGGYEVIIADMLNNICGALLMDSRLQSIQIVGSNTTVTPGIPNGAFDVNVTFATSFIDGMSVQQGCELFKSRLVNEFLNGYTGHNYVPIAFSVRMSLLGESVINVSYDNGMTIQFVYPVFADSLYSPLLTNNQATLQSLANETRAITSNLLGIM